MFTSRFTLRLASALMILILCGVTVGCTQTQVISDIDMALNAAELILPLLLPLVGPAVTPAIAQVEAWVPIAVQALAAVDADLQKGGEAAIIAAAITRDLAGIVASVPSLAGLPAAIATDVQALVSAIQNILQKYGSVALATSLKGGAYHGLKGNLHYTGHNLERVQGQRARAVELQSRFIGLRRR